MPIWIIAGIIPPFLFAIINHIDKYLLSKKDHPSSVNLLMVYSTGFAIITTPILLLVGFDEIFVNLGQIIVQIVGGVLITSSIYLYLIALEREEASKVAPLFLLVPIFGYLFSYILLNEVLSIKEIFACTLIISGALILSLEFREESRKIHFRHGVLIIMTACSAFQAAQETLFKYVTIDNSFVASVFWLHVGIMLYGITLILIKKNLLREFTDSVKNSGVRIFSLNFFSEGISSIAYIIKDYSLLLAPVAVVMTLNGYQPAFVFILGIILTLFFPKISIEKIKYTHLLHKSIAITIMIIGTLMVAQHL